MIRASLVRALIASAVLAATLALAGCYSDDGYQLPTRAMKELSPQMLALLEKKHMPKDSPILVRIFKEESELEVWKQDTTGRYQLLKVYPICRWSGELGPKIREGDRQAPEGFYGITPALMNPNSSYYLAINTGFPNTYDRANGRTGAFLMIHGDCSSRGCYAMTDEEIGEIYSLAREALLGGQHSFQLQAYPFRMTPANLARHRNNPNMPFWKMIKVGYDHFEVTHLEPKVDVCERRYVFDAEPPAHSTRSFVFTPSGRCPGYVVPQAIAGPALQKERNDEIQIAQLTRFNVPMAPIRTGTDGGMNKVFVAQLASATRTVDREGHLHVMLGSAPDSAGGSQSSFASRLFGGLFESKPAAEPTQVAATEPAPQQHAGQKGLFGHLFSSKDGGTRQANATASGLRGSEPATTGTIASRRSVAHNATASAAGLRPRARTEARRGEPHKSEPQIAAKRSPAKPRQEASAVAPIAGGGVLSGAQPVVAAGSFDSRWGGIH